MRSSFVFAAIAAGVAGTASADVVINEFMPNPPGADPAMTDIELLGVPGDTFSGWILSVEADSSSSVGTVDRAAQVSGTFDANGLLVVTVPDLENPSFALFLVDNFTGAAGTTNIDPNGDGIVDDASSFGTIFDAIGSPDNVGDETFTSYASQLGGTNMSYVGSEPQNVFRDGTSGALYAVDFNGMVYDASANVLNNADFNADPTVTTYGGVNPSLVPAPASLALIGLGGIAAIRRRR